MIHIERGLSSEDLYAAVREVPLANSSAQPYRNAEITMRRVRISECRPTTLYLLNRNLQKQSYLRDALRNQGFDPLSLEGSLDITTNDRTVSLLPPIVEVGAEGEEIIVDGHHRLYNALCHIGHKATANVISISNVDPKYPFYAYPNDWSEIAVHATVPQDSQEKKHYRPDYKSLYRDFSELNGSTMREAGNAT